MALTAGGGERAFYNDVFLTGGTISLSIYNHTFWLHCWCQLHVLPREERSTFSMIQRIRASSKSKNKSSTMRIKSLMTLPGWFLLVVSCIAMVLLVSSIMWQMQSTLMLAANANTSSISKSNFRSVQSGALLQLPGQGGNRKNRDPTSLNSEYSLNPDQLEALLRRRDQPSVVAYFAPWCGHCQHFIPKYIKFADQHTDITQSSSFKPLSLESSEESGGQNSVVFGTVDCVSQRELCDRQVVPTDEHILILSIPTTQYHILSIRTHALETDSN